MTKKKLFTVDDLWQIERIGGVSLSPDGAQAVCAVTRYSMDDNKGASSLWLLSTFGGGPRQLTSCGDACRLVVSRGGHQPLPRAKP